MGRDWTWACGLWEGEGSVGIAPNGYPRLVLGMTDRDVVEAFKGVLGFGCVYVRPVPGHKTMYVYETSGWNLVTHVFKHFEPMLGDRRLAQFQRTLAHRPPRPPTNAVECIEPSEAAYRRHLRAKEPPCDGCRKANRVYERERKGDGRKARFPNDEGYVKARSRRPIAR